VDSDLRGLEEQLLHRDVKRFRGGLVFKAHRLLYLLGIVLLLPPGVEGVTREEEGRDRPVLLIITMIKWIRTSTSSCPFSCWLWKASRVKRRDVTGRRCPENTPRSRALSMSQSCDQNVLS